MTASRWSRHGIAFASSNALWPAPVALVALVVLGPSTRACSQDATSFIAWRAPSACPDQRELDARIARLAPERASATQVLAEVSEIESGFVLELRDADGLLLREARSSSCDTLASAAALIVATTLAATAEAAPAAEPEPVVAGAPPAARDAAAPAQEGALDETREWRGRDTLRGLVSVAVGASYAPLPLTEIVVVPSVGIGVDALELSLGFFGAGLSSIEERPGGAWMLAARLALGFSIEVRQFELCARLVSELGEYRLEAQMRSGGNLYASFGFGLEARFFFDRTHGLALWLDMVPAVWRPSIVLSDVRAQPDWATVITALAWVARIS